MTNTKIKFTYKDVPYVLEYDRDSVTQMEQSGLVMSDIKDKPVTNLTLLFQGAFLKNHRKTLSKKELVDEILKNIKDKDKLFDQLIAMVGETYSTLVDGDENEGNIEWDTSDLN